jgi:hypothetical protein
MADRSPGKLLNGCTHFLDVLMEIEHRTVVEERPPLRIKADEFEMISQIEVRFGEDALENAGQSQDRRPHVKAKAVPVKDSCFTTAPFILVEKNYTVAARGESASSSEASKARADHSDGMM